MELMPSDEVLAIIVPIVVYWAYSGIYMMLSSLEEYRLHPRKDEDMKNLVSKWEVAKGVLLQQLVQAAVAFIMFTVTRDKNVTATSAKCSLTELATRFFMGMLVLDAWQYFWHRYMHMNKFLYRHIHSWHHRLIIPYSFGSQYNHPIEGLVLDTLGGALAFIISGMTPRTSIFFFSFSTMKGIDDHCGYGFLETYSISSFGIILHTMISIINSMATSTIFLSHSLLHGIKFLGLTCLTNLKREHGVVFKLGRQKLLLLKIY